MTKAIEVAREFTQVHREAAEEIRELQGGLDGFAALCEVLSAAQDVLRAAKNVVLAEAGART